MSENVFISERVNDYFPFGNGLVHKLLGWMDEKTGRKYSSKGHDFFDFLGNAQYYQSDACLDGKKIKLHFETCDAVACTTRRILGLKRACDVLTSKKIKINYEIEGSERSTPLMLLPIEPAKSMTNNCGSWMFPFRWCDLSVCIDVFDGCATMYIAGMKGCGARKFTGLDVDIICKVFQIPVEVNKSNNEKKKVK